jgi:hypothetical protein
MPESLSVMQASSKSSSGYVFMSLAALSALLMLQGYQAALQKHLAAVGQKIAQLRGGGAGVASAKMPNQSGSALLGGGSKGITQGNSSDSKQAEEQQLGSPLDVRSPSAAHASSVSLNTPSSRGEPVRDDVADSVEDGNSRQPRGRRLVPASSLTGRGMPS